MRRHLRSRTLMLRRKRLNEVVATDTYFSPIRSLEGYTCAQVFFCCTSRVIQTIGMATKSDFPAIYKGFLRQHGIPHTLRRDNATSEDSFAIRDINRDYCISDAFTEPHSPWQNPAETNGVRFLKPHAQVLMDRAGTPASLWFLAHRYVADVYNVTSHELLKWQTPAQVQGGIHRTYHMSLHIIGLNQCCI